MNKQISRRSVLKTSIAAGGFWIAPEIRAAESLSANEKLNVACIGIGGRGAANVRGIRGENVVALCDVDDERAGKVYQENSGAEKFYDYRVMFDKIEKQIDAVVVSTPDHTHFHPSMAAMELGKHLYCEKPMAHNVWEIRTMTDFARANGLATQLGCQRHALDVMHRSVEIIQSDRIGTVTEVHSWVGGDRGMPEIPTSYPEVPPNVKWDLWVGPAKFRPYHPSYCPYGWRFWWDFGTGETGNWGCHILDIPFWALGLKYPTRVEASGPPVHDDLSPKSLASKMRFEDQGVDLHWYHTKSGPPVLKEHGIDGSGMNTLFIGSRGMLLTGFNKLRLLPEEKFADATAPEKTIPDSPGFYKEWIDACKGGPAATCNFDYSGPLAETVLLANTGYRAGGGFDWDAKTLTASGNDQAQPLIRQEYRKGWEVNY